MSREFQFVFRQLSDPIPEGWVSGVRWVVECYESGPTSLPFPMGQAWVSDYTPFKTDSGQPDLISLDFVLVADQYRQRGIGKALVRACEGRWPNVMLTDAISPKGQSLLDSVNR